MNATAERLGFLLPSTAIEGRIYIPKRYDPALAKRLTELNETHEPLLLGALIDKGEIIVESGHEIGKITYGTGTIPYVRTSDLFNWEIKFDPKQGVSADVLAAFGSRQHIQPGDILFVRDGTYLIGTSAMVTDHDGPMLYQSHVLRFRCSHGSRIGAPLLLALLNSTTVKRQVRAKQFTADIIDTIGDRYRELLLPVPRSQQIKMKIADEVSAIVNERARLREVVRRVPYVLQGLIADEHAAIPEREYDAVESQGFLHSSADVRNGIFLPRYYNPAIDEELRRLKRTHELPTIGDLVDESVISLSTGIEPGKMAYGGGDIPFVRTSDIATCELKADVKQGVSTLLYEQTREKLDVQGEDIFVVRDGTYLVGTSCMLTAADTRIVYCGGLYKIRVHDKERLDPYLLLAAINAPVARRQMRSKQFTRDIIDTIGKRILEVHLPLPRDNGTRHHVARLMRSAVERRAVLRNQMQAVAAAIDLGTEAH